MKRLLFITSQREIFEKYTQLCAKSDCSLQFAGDEAAALHRLKAWKPQLVLLDSVSSPLPTNEFFSSLRSLGQEEYSVILVIIRRENVSQLAPLLGTLIDDYLIYPFDLPFDLEDARLRLGIITRLKDSIEMLKRANHRIDELVLTDELTGLLNLRAIFRRGDEQLVRSRRFKTPSCVVLLNLDNFSLVNQNYGFAVGNLILQQLADRLRSCARAVDLLARIGADEFMVFLIETNLDNAVLFANKLRELIEYEPFKNRDQLIRLTVSLGVSGLTSEPYDQRMSDFMHSASEGLRLAKANGSNRIEIIPFSDLSFDSRRG